ncbi:uncharacterized protein LOC121424202 [Lytechinus variegatus]|uniref:uncharacterized protein LOC121424202 n=1 Tax=Lytechinus variegatus TaxID=7654 RepID=UPI001BB16245|nr:uncharacterized protein LOC121424202 [Lytechinus variegatus]
MDCPSTRWQLKSRRQRHFKKTKARLRPSKPVSSTLDRFIPHRHIDISEFQLNSSMKKKTEQDKRQQQPSSSSMSQSYDTMGESFTTSSSDESLMSVSTSSSLSTSLSEDALDDTTCYGDPFSEEVAAILFEGYDKKSGDVLNFRSRKYEASKILI